MKVKKFCQFILLNKLIKKYIKNDQIALFNYLSKEWKD